MRFGIVGLGGATEMFHLPALRRLPSAEIVGGADLSAERRAAWTTASGTPAYPSLDELIERGRPDVVVVATPPGLHRENCLAAIGAGCHVFCEKPFVETTGEADEVIAAAASAGRVVAINHEFRENPIYRALHDGVASGRHGRLVFCQAWQLLDLPPWDEPAAWRAGMANRALFEGGVHLIDLMIWIFGAPPTAVYARHSAGFHEQREADAIQLVTLEFPDGRLGQITIDRLTAAASRYLEIRADCEVASLRASFGGRASLRLGAKRAEKPGIQLEFGRTGLAWAERGTARETLARNPKDAHIVGTTRLLAGLVDAIAGGGEPPSGAREARTVLAVIEAAYESGRSGRRVELVRADGLD